MDNLVPTAMKADKYKNIGEKEEKAGDKLSGPEQVVE